MQQVDTARELATPDINLPLETNNSARLKQIASPPVEVIEGFHHVGPRHQTIAPEPVQQCLHLRKRGVGSHVEHRARWASDQKFLDQGHMVRRKQPGLVHVHSGPTPDAVGPAHAPCVQRKQVKACPPPEHRRGLMTHHSTSAGLR